MPADLHIHTKYSDGKDTPKEIVDQAKEVGLTTIAVSDHDSVEGVGQAVEEGKKVGIENIPAAELSAEYHRLEIHILGYFIDYKADWLLEALERLREARATRIYKIADKLNSLGLKIDPQRIFEIAGGGSPGRPHVAEAMVEKKYVRNPQEAFEKYLKLNGPAYIGHYKLSPGEAIRLIFRAGGVSVLAHPGICNCDSLIPQLVEEGLGGLEVYYPTHNYGQIKHYLSLAEKYKLAVTGGSDYHGRGSIKARDIALGSSAVDDVLVERLREKKS